MIFPISDSGQRIVLTPPVLQRFARYRQTRWWHREAGGQLFARFCLPEIRIEEATGPRRTDWRTRFSYHPDRRAEQREIAARHPLGLHFIGDWHTHPEDLPVPSTLDERSMREAFSESKHVLNGFILAIVGRREFPAGFALWLYDESSRMQLQPALATE